MGEESRPSYPPPPRADDRFAIWSQQMDDVLEKITHRWRGESEVYDRSTGLRNWERPKKAMALMNDAGVDFVISQIHPIVCKNTFLSNLGNEEVYRIARVKSMTLTKSLFLDFKRYEIRPQNFEEICVTICAIYLLALKRPLMGGERTFLGKTGIENILRQVNENKGVKLWGG